MKVAPTGGPPDTIPAHTVSVQPPSGSRNLTDPHFTVVFDDYVDRSIRNDITVIPSVRLNSSYSGDEISIWFDEPPKPNTTYAITIGTNWKDLRGNSATEATNIVFSTGPDLDSGVISGHIEARGYQNVVIFVFPQADTLGPQFDPRKTIAPYQVPVGSMGAFTVGGLKDGTYRIIGVRDANRNGLPDHDEEFAMALSDIDVVKGASARVDLFLGPSMAAMEADTAKAPAHVANTLRADTRRTDTLRADTLRADTLPADTLNADTLSADTTRKKHPGSVEGTFSGEPDSRGPYIVRFIDQAGVVGAYVAVTSGERWKVDSIAAGTYKADVFIDENHDARYSHGMLFPFEFAEPRFPISADIVVRERWTTEDVHLSMTPPTSN